MPSTPRVTPRTRRPAVDITLTDFVRTYALEVEATDLKEVPQTPSTLRLDAGGGGSAAKHGNFDPTMAQALQDDWSGGRGQENFSDDPSRFFDSQACWTLTPNKLLNGGWVGVGDRNVRSLMSYSHSPLNFIGLVGARRYQAMYRESLYNFNADKAYFWIRRIGSPGTLTVELRTNNAGVPSATVLQTATVTISDVTDLVSVYKAFDWTGTQAITLGSAYHVVIYGASTDTQTNHWEVGVDPNTAADGNFSTNGSSWTSGGGLLNFSVVEADIDRTFTFFRLDRMLYAVDKRADGTASHIYMNGFRGKVTAATATTFTDTNQTFVGNPGKIYIISGTGAGQAPRNTSSFTSTQITISQAWDITPDTTSEYVSITIDWAEITSHGLTKPVTSVAVITSGEVSGSDNSRNSVYFAQGTKNGANTRRMRFNASLNPPAHEFLGETNSADILLSTPYGGTNNTVTSIWAADNNGGGSHGSNLKRSDSKNWGTGLDLSQNNSNVGGIHYRITGLYEYKGGIVITKEDSIWTLGIDGNGLIKVPVGLNASPNLSNGVAGTAGGLFFYFNYMHSVEKLYGTTLDDIGPWQGSGIPVGRTGIVASMVYYFSWLICAIDAGASGTSSVLVYDGTGWHELFRAYEVGQRIRSIYVHSIEDRVPVLTIAMGNALWNFLLPKDALNPLNDSFFEYQHEAVLTMSTIDFGNVRLPKLFKEIAVLTKNLRSGTQVNVDYQLNENIGSTTWQTLGAILQAPEDTLPQGFGNARKIRIRLRLLTNQANTPVEIQAVIQEGYSRTPVKYQYNLRLRQKKTNTNRRGGRMPDPDVLYAQLREWANGATRILMRSRAASLDNRYVIVEPPVINRTSWDSNKSGWGGDLLITLRDE